MKTWAIVAIQMMSSLNMIATQSSSTSHVKRWFSWLSHQSVQILSGRFMGWAWTLATLCGKWGKMNHLIKFLEKSSRKHWNDFFPGVDCSAPPEMPSAGSWQWAGNVSYGSDSFFYPRVSASFPNNRSTASYTCGPYGQFVNSTGSLYTTAVSECLWNKTWSPSQLDPCKA